MPAASSFAATSSIPAIGSMKMRMIFSGESWATFSMSMPPSLDPIIATFCVARSVSTAT